MSFMRCRHSDCQKSSDCNRYNDDPDDDTVPVDYKNICGEWNGYKWLWEVNKEVVKVDEKGDT